MQIRNPGLLFLRRMRCPLRHAARAHSEIFRYLQNTKVKTKLTYESRKRSIHWPSKMTAGKKALAKQKWKWFWCSLNTYVKRNASHIHDTPTFHDTPTLHIIGRCTYIVQWNVELGTSCRMSKNYWKCQSQLTLLDSHQRGLVSPHRG
jgi:hypothetical protein